MSSEFKEPHPNFKPDNKIITPFHTAEAVWNERIGNEASRTRNWRLIATGAIGIALISVIGLIYQSTKSKVDPFYIRINSDGYAQTMRPEHIKTTAQTREIQYFLANFVKNIRTIPLDVVVAKSNYTEAYDFMTKPASLILEEYYKKESNPALLLGKQTTSVKIISILPKSKDSYQVHWQEDTFELNGKLLESVKYTGLFTIIIKAPSDEKTLFVNPLGIYINNFAWAKDINK